MMEKSEFYNFETSCLCEVCSNCKIKNLSDFLNEHHLDLDDFNDFNNDFNNYGWSPYFIEKDSIRPQECCLFEKYQLFDINGSIPWCMKQQIKNCFNANVILSNSFDPYRLSGFYVYNLIGQFVKSLNDCCKKFDFIYHLSNPYSCFKPNKNTRSIIFKNKLTGLYYFVLLTKKHTFTLKTLAGLKINEHLNQKWQLQSLVEQHFLPKQLADFLLNLHKIY